MKLTVLTETCAAPLISAAGRREVVQVNDKRYLIKAFKRSHSLVNVSHGPARPVTMEIGRVPNE